MSANQLLTGKTIDFEKKCHMRMWVSVGLFLLGLAAAILGLAVGAEKIPASLLASDFDDFVPGFYTGTGCGLMAASLITWIRQRRYLTNAELCKKKSIEENDERMRLIGLRCWAYAGYSMFIFLYIGMLVSLFISSVFLKTLLLVLSVFALLLLVFKVILTRIM